MGTPPDAEPPEGKRCSKCGRGPADGAVFGHSGPYLRAQCNGCLAAGVREARRRRSEEAASRPLPEAPPPDMRCGRCKRTAGDGARFQRDRTQKHGFRPTCRECNNVQRRARYYADLAETKRKRNAWRQANLERERRRGRDYRAENLETYRLKQRTRHWANRDQYNAQRRAYRRSRRDHFNARRRDWYARNRERINRRRRELYHRDVALTNKRRRDWYYAHRDVALRLARSYRRRHRERLGVTERVRSLRRHAVSRASSLDAPRFSGAGDFHEVYADAGASDPEREVIGREERSSALAWAETALSREELDVLTAFADSGFDAVAGAELLGMGLADFERLLARVQRRAREEIKET